MYFYNSVPLLPCYFVTLLLCYLVTLLLREQSEQRTIYLIDDAGEVAGIVLEV